MCIKLLAQIKGGTGEHVKVETSAQFGLQENANRGSIVLRLNCGKSQLPLLFWLFFFLLLQ